MKILASLFNLSCALLLAKSAMAQSLPPSQHVLQSALQPLSQPVSTAGVLGAPNASPRQDAQALRETVEAFLRKQTAGLPGDVSVAANPVDPRLNVTACATPEAFLPPGGRLWGKTTVGVRCNAPSAWTVYLTASVRVFGEYVTAALPLAQGQQLGPQDVATVKGELTSLPQGIVTDPALAVGRTLAFSIQAGKPIRQDALRSPRAIHQGQVVKIISSGPGFRVAAEGKAVSNANEGQIAQATASNGQLISGVARLNGVIEVMF